MFLIDYVKNDKQINTFCFITVPHSLPNSSKIEVVERVRVSGNKCVTP